MIRARFYFLPRLCFAALGVLTFMLACMSPALADGKEAEAFINTLGDEALAIVRDTSLDDATKETKLVELFSKGVDVEWIGKFVLGKYWRSASDAQKAAYMEYYHPFLIRSYTSRFKEYTGETFEIITSHPASDNEFIVETKIIRPKAEPVLVNYRVRWSEGTGGEKPSYKVFDFIVEGVSLLATQRSEFGAVVARDGLDALTAKLKTRVESFSASAPAAPAVTPSQGSSTPSAAVK